MKKFLFLFLGLFFLFAGQSYAGDITLEVQAPTTNEDGSALTDLDGYKLYQSSVSGGPYTQVVDIVDPADTTRVLTGFVDGTYYFVATAYNTASTESAYSNEVTKTVVNTPSPPVLTVVDPTAFTFIKQIDRLILLPVGTVPLGTVCDEDQEILGHHVIPRAEVQWSGSVKPYVVVAKCA